MQDPQGAPKGCVIWMHGLGADGTDMQGLVQAMGHQAPPLRHVFLDAPIRPVTLNGGMPMRAWYDILGMEFSHREDQQGITASASLITAAIEAQIAAGFRSEQILLAGFSQGGAMALWTSLNEARPLGGVIALSAYLPLVKELQWRQARQTPFFLGYGSQDPLVLPSWTELSIQGLRASGYDQLTIQDYPMEHSICMEEVEDICRWLHSRFEGDSA